MAPTRCRSCGAALRWGTSVTSGKRVPVDNEPAEDGNILLVDVGGESPFAVVLKGSVLDEARGAGSALYVWHSETCSLMATELLPDRLRTPDEVSAYLGVPRDTLAVWRHRGHGPRSFKVGRHVRYRAADVEAWLEDQATPRPA